jgi:hypothetical protein
MPLSRTNVHGQDEGSDDFTQLISMKIVYCIFRPTVGLSIGLMFAECRSSVKLDVLTYGQSNITVHMASSSTLHGH